MARLTDSRLGLCIVGCGAFAHSHAQVLIERRDRLRLYFASRDGAKAAAYARQYGADDAFGSYEGAAADPRVEALVFCTPHSLHRENLELGAAHGKHVLMEKPVATTLEDAAAMQDAAKAAGIRFMVAENFRYLPQVRAAQELLQRGAIGRLLALHLQTTKYQRSTGWRLSRRMMGGGALIDGGIHKVTVLRLLGGEATVVSAVTPPKVFPEMEGEEAVSLWTTFRSGAVGTLNYSWAALGEPGRQAFLAVGSEGYISFDFYEADLTVASGSRVERRRIEGELSGMGAMLDAFLELVATGKPVPTSPEEAAGDLRFVLAAYASAEAGGRPVDVGV